MRGKTPPNTPEPTSATSPNTKGEEEGDDVLDALRALLKDSEQSLRKLPAGSPLGSEMPPASYLLVVVDDDATVLEGFAAGVRTHGNFELLCLNPLELSLSEMVGRIGAFVLKEEARDAAPADGEGFGTATLERIRRCTLLIDHQFGLATTTGLDLIRQIDESEYIWMRALPRAMITGHQFEEGLVDKYITQGADDVFCRKADGQTPSQGKGSRDDDRKPDDGFHPLLSFANLLGDWRRYSHRIYLRAQQRFWQSLRKKLEDWLEKGPVESAPSSQEEVDGRLAVVWAKVRRHMLDSGFVDHAHLRRLVEIDGGLRLQSLPPFAPFTKSIVDIPWDAIPLLHQLVEHAEAKHEYVWRSSEQGITKEDLGLGSKRAGSVNNALSLLLGQHGIGIGLCKGERVWGTLTLTRASSARAFTHGDESELRSLAQRFDYYSEQLAQAVDLRHRQLGLAKLGLTLAQCQTKDSAIQVALDFLWAELFPVPLLTSLSSKRTHVPKDCRVSCRLLDTGSGLIFRREPWVRSTMKEEPPIEILIFQKKSLYAEVLRTGVPLFHSDLSKAERHIGSAPSPMGAAMVLPLCAGSGGRQVVFGALNCEHASVSFFGRDMDRSADFALASAVASLLAKSILAMRNQQLQTGLLQLANGMGTAKREAVLDHMASLVYDATGFAVMGWCPKPPEWNRNQLDVPWPAESVWEGLKPEEAMPILLAHGRDHPSSVATLIRRQTARDSNWDIERLESDWLKTGVSRLVRSSSRLVLYDEIRDSNQSSIKGDAFLVDTASWQLETRAQATVPVTSHGGGGERDRIGVLFLGFPQAPGLSEDQEEWLAELGALLGQYLQAIEADMAYAEAPFRRDVMKTVNNIKHSLKARLRNLRGHLERTKEGTTDLAAMRKSLDGAMNDLSNFEGALVRADWDFRPVQLTTVEVDRVWNDAAANLKVAEGEGFAVTHSHTNLILHTDHHILKNLFETLIENSYEAALDATIGTTKPISVWLEVIANDDGRCELRVSDNGPRMADSVREHLFEFGFTTKPRGSGWGLYWCRERLDSVGASVELTSASEVAGEGVAFTISFPIDAVISTGA